MKKLLTLSFIPPLHDLSLLVLRATVGVSMLLIHGWDKLMNFNATVEKLRENFPAPLPAAAVLAESVAAGLIIVGLFTRWAALALGIAMGVAFFKVHGGLLDAKGELAFLYLAFCATIFLAGPGRISADAAISRSQSKPIRS